MEITKEKLGVSSLDEIKAKRGASNPMRRNCTVEDVCLKLHRDFKIRFKFARVWGRTAKFPGQTIRRLDKVLHDKDIVEIHLS